MSGGIQETYDLKNYQTSQAKNELWEIIIKSRKLKSMTAAYIDADPYVREARLSNGLVMGHAYTVTRIALVEYKGSDVKLIRIRSIELN
jgi:calpain